MLAHAYCRHRAKSTIFPLISRASGMVLRDFTAKELQILIARWPRLVISVFILHSIIVYSIWYKVFNW